MKNIVLSAVAVLAMSTFAIAGGDIAPVEEPMVVVEEPVVEDNGFYLGIAYSATGVSVDDGDRLTDGDGDADSVMLQLGYKFNPYIAVEGRYWDGNNGFDAWGIYAKPMYPVTTSFDIYGLLGYGNAGTDTDSGVLDESEFQWGVGAAYSFTDSFAIFIDYVELYDDSVNNVDYSIDTVNVGVTYTF